MSPWSSPRSVLCYRDSQPVLPRHDSLLVLELLISMSRTQPPSPCNPKSHALPLSHLTSVLRVIPFPCHGNIESHSAHSRQRHRPPVCLTLHKPPPHRHPHPVQYTSAVAPHGSAPQYHISTAQQPHIITPPRSTSHLSNPLPPHPTCLTLLSLVTTAPRHAKRTLRPRPARPAIQRLPPQTAPTHLTPDFSISAVMVSTEPNSSNTPPIPPIHSREVRKGKYAPLAGCLSVCSGWQAARAHRTLPWHCRGPCFCV